MIRKVLPLITGIVAGLACAEEVTFYRDVVPILQKRCEECHRPGVLGWILRQRDDVEKQVDGSSTLIRSHEPRRRRMITGTIARISGLIMRYGHVSQLAT